MIILNATTKKLQAVMGAAVTTTAPSFYVAFVDVLTYVPGENHGALAGTADVDLVAAPGAGLSRQIKNVSIVNRDTVTQTITIKIDVSATDTIMFAAILAANDVLQFDDTNGWRVTDSTGALKTSQSSGAPSGAAGGDLTGTYPNPTIAALAVTDAKVATANKDGAAATPSMRTLGTGALQAASGDDARLTPLYVQVFS